MLIEDDIQKETKISPQSPPVAIKFTFPTDTKRVEIDGQFRPFSMAH